MTELIKSTPRYTFPKSARLHHKTLVDGVFACGQTLYEFPFRLSWRALSAEELRGGFRVSVPDKIGPVQLMVTIPKKKRRHAVDRVRMRRLVKETFRHLRPGLLEVFGKLDGVRTVSIAVVYLHNENIDQARVDRKFGRLIAKLQKQLISQYGSGAESSEEYCPESLDSESQGADTVLPA